MGVWELDHLISWHYLFLFFFIRDLLVEVRNGRKGRVEVEVEIDIETHPDSDSVSDI